MRSTIVADLLLVAVARAEETPRCGRFELALPRDATVTFTAGWCGP